MAESAKKPQSEQWTEMLHVVSAGATGLGDKTSRRTTCERRAGVQRPSSVDFIEQQSKSRKNKEYNRKYNATGSLSVSTKRRRR